eukprot:gene9783-10818_t
MDPNLVVSPYSVKTRLTEQYEQVSGADKSYLIEEDEGFICEGSQDPLADGRMTALALECWNLRKTVLDLNGQVLKHQQDMKTQKNLLRNLQRLVHDVQEENKTRTKENVTLKSKTTELEKKLQDSTSNNVMLNNNINRYKKITTTMQGRIAILEKEKKAMESNKDETIGKLKELSADTENSLRERLRQLDTENTRLSNENQTLKNMLREATDKSQQLMEHAEGLQQQVDSLNSKCESTSDFLNHELEMAYEQLHDKLEQVWSARIDAGTKLWLKEHENEQLMSFILSEGLQLPDLPKPTTSPPFFGTLASPKI